MGGRPPKPTALHVLQGTFDDRRHTDRGDVLYTDSQPAKVGGLSEHASFCWDLIVTNTPVQVLKSVDAMGLDMLCTWWAKYQQAKETGDDRLLRTATEQFGRLATQFGLSPTARCKILAENAAKRDGNDDLRREYLA